MMKTFIKNSIIGGILLCAVMVSSVSFSQELLINDGTARYKKDDYPAVVIYMEPQTKDVKKAWKDFLKDRYKVRLKGYGFLTNRDVLSAENVNFSELATSAIDFYTEIIKDNNLTKMSVFASLGNNVNIGMGNDYRQYYQMKGIVQNFLDTYLRKYYENQVEDAGKRVTDLEKTRNDKQSTIANNDKEIIRLQSENQRLTQEVAQNRTDYISAQEELTQRKIKLDNIIRQLASANNPVFYNNENKNNYNKN